MRQREVTELDVKDRLLIEFDNGDIGFAMKTQYQLYEDAQRKLFDENRAFMDMVNDPVNPVTNADLEALIKRKPEKYGRFSGFLGKLK